MSKVLAESVSGESTLPGLTVAVSPGAHLALLYVLRESSSGVSSWS